MSGKLMGYLFRHSDGSTTLHKVEEFATAYHDTCVEIINLYEDQHRQNNDALLARLKARGYTEDDLERSNPYLLGQR